MTTDLTQLFLSCRKHTEHICAPLKTEDYSVQPIVDVSPPKWHLAHSTWFFEQFVLVPNARGYKLFSPDFAYLFNSYYNNVGQRVLRPNRGNMTRPTVEEVYAYRKYVTEATIELIQNNPSNMLSELIELGINHEQQHQELLAYDIKYILGHQPFFPEYDGELRLEHVAEKPGWISIKAGVYKIGHQSEGFCFDNELGVHQVYLEDFEISKCLVTNQEYLEFILDGGYNDFNLWHADGWDWIKQNDINAPLYWHNDQSNWKSYDFNGYGDISGDLPVMNVSLYEAFAFANWKGMRLPTEFEWEIASDQFKWGQLWEWTNSAYLPYPKFKKAPGAIGEYNGKFMINQMVLRGASFATSEGHSRPTYRNFFPAASRWQFSGIRLAK